MNNFVFIVILLSLKNIVECDINVTDPLFKELPPVFRIDDDNLCKAQGNLFCKITVEVLPTNLTNKSAHWKLIADTINHSKFYNHNELFHAICVSDICPRNITEDATLDMQRKLSQCYGLRYKHLGLQFNITDLTCNYGNQYSIGKTDISVMFIAVIYLSGIILATYADYKRNSGKDKTIFILKFEHKLVSSLSLLANWKKLCSLNDRQDFQKLKFIQGIRLYNTLLIIFCHTVCSYMGAFILNTEYFEMVHKNQIRQFIVTLFVFLVQTFFLLSAFLLSYHVCQTMETYKGSKLRYISLTFLNRYLRILPPVLAMILLTNTIWIMGLFQGPVRDIYSDKEYRRCQTNWWTNLIFVNNHYNEVEMCYFLTWYLAADTQLYLVSLVILVIIWKFTQKIKTILAVVISMGMLIPPIMCYKYGLDIIFRLTPENLKIDSFRSFNFNAIYTSTYTNMASYMVGLTLGCFYFNMEKKKTYTKYHHYVCMGLFSFLPISVVYISSQDHSEGVNIILSGLVKPCYALGIGAGILAMSQQKTGLIKKICEFKPVIFLGNFTYSTYVVQYGIVFYRTACAREPLFLSDYVLMTSFTRDAVLSIFCGFLMHILVEMPAIQLQKMYIPQIRHMVSLKQCTKTKIN